MKSISGFSETLFPLVSGKGLVSRVGIRFAGNIRFVKRIPSPQVGINVQRHQHKRIELHVSFSYKDHGYGDDDGDDSQSGDDGDNSYALDSCYHSVFIIF